MPRPPDPRRVAVTLVGAAVLGLVLVLGLWQQVDRACLDGEADLGDALASCDPIPLADDDLPGAPAAGELGSMTVAN